MIICPACSTGNLEGVFYCDECGSPLVGAEVTVAVTSSTQQLQKVSDQLKPGDAKIGWGTTYLKSDTVISLHFQETGNKVTLPTQEETVLGRTDEHTKTYPDVDLTPFGAIDRGVSRTHVTIKRGEDTVTLIDLDSVNGTFLNGQRVLPQQPRILRDGDEIRFGKLTARIYFR